LLETGPEGVSRTVGNSAVQINNVGVDCASNIAHICGIGDNLWQLLQIQTARSENVTLQTFAVNVRNAMLSTGSLLGPSVRSVHPIGFEVLLSTSMINVTLILEMNHTFGDVPTNALRCVISRVTGEQRLLYGEQVDRIIKACMDTINQAQEQEPIEMMLSTCGSGGMSIETAKCN
jgi:hypothetical protein